MSSLVVLKDTKSDCLRLIDLCAQGQELYRGLKRASDIGCLDSRIMMLLLRETLSKEAQH